MSIEFLRMNSQTHHNIITLFPFLKLFVLILPLSGRWCYSDVGFCWRPSGTAKKVVVHLCARSMCSVVLKVSSSNLLRTNQISGGIELCPVASAHFIFRISIFMNYCYFNSQNIIGKSYIAVNMMPKLHHLIMFRLSYSTEWRMGQVMKVRLSCYLILLSIDGKIREQDSCTSMTWPIWSLIQSLFLTIF